MDLNHGSTGYEPVGISGRSGTPTAFLTTLPRCAAGMQAPVYELPLGDPPGFGSDGPAPPSGISISRSRRARTVTGRRRPTLRWAARGASHGGGIRPPLPRRLPRRGVGATGEPRGGLVSMGAGWAGAPRPVPPAGRPAPERDGDPRGGRGPDEDKRPPRGRRGASMPPTRWITCRPTSPRPRRAGVRPGPAVRADGRCGPAAR